MSETREKILNEGDSFDFFQAMKLLEDLDPEAPRVGGSGPFNRETIRIRPSKQLSFPPGDVSDIECIPDKESDRSIWRITQNFMGLYGANSPLPIYLPLMIAQWYADKDPLRDFMDIFNNRAVSLYYRAWKKYRFSAGVSSDGADPITDALCSLLGREPEESDSWTIEARRLVRYAGLLAGGNRSASGLEGLIKDYFNLDHVKVTPFLARRIPLEQRQRNRVGSKGRNNWLGTDLVLGGSIQDRGGQFLLTIGPMDRKSFDQLLPGRRAYKDLLFLVRFFTRRQLDFSLELVMRANSVSPMMVSSRYKVNPLGRASWVGKPRSQTVMVRLTP